MALSSSGSSAFCDFVRILFVLLQLLRLSLIIKLGRLILLFRGDSRSLNSPNLSNIKKMERTVGSRCKSAMAASSGRAPDALGFKV